MASFSNSFCTFSLRMADGGVGQKTCGGGVASNSMEQPSHRMDKTHRSVVIFSQAGRWGRSQVGCKVICRVISASNSLLGLTCGFWSVLLLQSLCHEFRFACIGKFWQVLWPGTPQLGCGRPSVRVPGLGPRPLPLLGAPREGRDTKGPRGLNTFV